MTATPDPSLMGGEKEREAEPGLGDLFERLVGDLRGVVYAEVDLFQTTYWLKLRGVLASLAIVTVGAILCLAALAALLMGLVLGLAAIMGPFTAAFVIGGGGVTLGALIVFFAARKLDRQVAALSGNSAVAEDPALDSANDD